MDEKVFCQFYPVYRLLELFEKQGFQFDESTFNSGGSLSLDKIFGCISDELLGYPVTYGRPAAARVSHAKPAGGG